MKKMLVMLLFTGGLFAQDKIYNVQQYCIDEKPFTQVGCDISGNEYSFVFVDLNKKEVVVFLSDTKIKYSIIKADTAKSGVANNYTLSNGVGNVEMKINANNTNIELTEPDRRISLLVGKSTKLQ